MPKTTSADRPLSAPQIFRLREMVAAAFSIDAIATALSRTPGSIAWHIRNQRQRHPELTANPVGRADGSQYDRQVDCIAGDRAFIEAMLDARRKGGERFSIGVNKTPATVVLRVTHPSAASRYSPCGSPAAACADIAGSDAAR